MRNLIIAFVSTIFLLTDLYAQAPFSIATDITVLRNLGEQQKFMSIGQTIQGNLHVSPKESLYGWFSYYVKGKFSNQFTATAKSPLTFPPTVDNRASSEWRYQQVSLGWKHYWIGSYNEEEKWNLYSLAGFGLLFAKTQTTLNKTLDTTTYLIPQTVGPANSKFRRLTFDLGLGVEYPIGADLYLYGDVRTWLPASEVHQSYVSNKSGPIMLSINAGLRILFQWVY